ncbi:hypothetical protein J1605_000303 [Eschrichtius robustus]|uniref:Omega-amidase NIT2 n=1 Tax=Eschrichtius robustus TaxID=9764 RepID=A0AB34HM83_ESCRO|nr:hypothetical protein J1605_000303 [Eschrichtius robustus]
MLHKQRAINRCLRRAGKKTPSPRIQRVRRRGGAGRGGGGSSDAAAPPLAAPARWPTNLRSGSGAGGASRQSHGRLPLYLQLDQCSVSQLVTGTSRRRACPLPMGLLPQLTVEQRLPKGFHLLRWEVLSIWTGDRLEARAFRLALIQLHVSSVKSDNLARACGLIWEAAKQGAKIVSLPECFNSPYGTKYFPEYAEKIPGDSTQKLSEVAKECGIYVIGGSIPEEDAGKLYNTCAVFGPDGTLLVKHRKLHLFDIDVPGKITFQESKTLSPGDSFSTFDTPYCRVGLGICYDIRFAELAQIYAQRGCQLLVYPAAFNLTTGPAHWELLQRGRAVDNQVYVATASPARDDKASYVAWGHSTVVSPWGEVIVKAGTEEMIVYSDIDLKKLAEIRQQIPIFSQKRSDLYAVEAKKP